MSSSSVSKLHDDVLWYIFMLNSHPITSSLDRDARFLFEFGSSRRSALAPEPSLVTTRRTSQVCHQWRQVLLGSHGHLVWANTLDMDYLNQTGDQWREEVLRRTGNVPLTVVGRVAERPLSPSTSFPHNEFAVPFFLELLNVHWERIHVLVVISAGSEVDRQLEMALNRPAPLLEYCLVRLFLRKDTQRNIAPFFAASAPSLTSFNLIDDCLDLSALSWACTLRYLKLNWPDVHVVTSEILQHLEKMPLLEIVFLDFVWSYNQKPEITTPIPHISLPRLRHLTLYSPRAPDLLPYINLSPQCKISIFCAYYNDRPHVYSKYVQDHFHEWNVTDISYRLELVPDLEPDGDYHPVYEIVLKESQQDRITPHFEYHCPATRTMSLALSMATALSSCRLDRVTTFHLNLFVFDSYIKNIDDPNADVELEALYDLVDELSYVDTVQAERKALKLFQEADARSTYGVFPDICTIIVDYWNDSLKECLLSRRAYAPISRVVLSEASRVCVGDPTVLQEAARLGVTVGWKIVGQKDEREFPPQSITSSQ